MSEVTNDVLTMLVSDVKFRKDMYPRIEHSATTVQKYAGDLSVLPPIEVNQHNELIDGWHRWTAHIKAKAESIPFKVTQTNGDAHLLELAIERNAKHGHQLTIEDKKSMAVRLYGLCVYGSQKERDEKKATLAKLLSVGLSTVQGWTSRTDKDVKAELRQKAFDLFLSCHTYDQIAEVIGYKKTAVSDFIKASGLFGNSDPGDSEQTIDSDADAEDADDDSNGLGRIKLTKEQIAIAAHDVQFEVPIYNIWKQQTKTAGASHFGNSEVRWVDNLLYLYTKPFDIVVDPFGGGGSTIDLCKKRLRRYHVSDRKPVVERGETHLPMIIRTPASLDRAALEDNEASEGALGNSFVDVAELVWRKLDGGMTQQAVADDLGMERGEVAKLAMLRKIDGKAWAVIVPAARSAGTNDAEGAGTQNVPDGTFSENLLRSILSLTAAQQLDLVTRLASKALVKSQFKTLAEKYRARNDAGAWIIAELGKGRGDVSNHVALRKIAPVAWDVIGTSVRGAVPSSSEGGVPASGTDVPFTEGLLRSILPLTAAQQLDLVTRLAHGPAAPTRT